MGLPLFFSRLNLEDVFPKKLLASQLEWKWSITKKKNSPQEARFPFAVECFCLLWLRYSTLAFFSTCPDFSENERSISVSKEGSFGLPKNFSMRLCKAQVCSRFWNLGKASWRCSSFQAKHDSGFGLTFCEHCKVHQKEKKRSRVEFNSFVSVSKKTYCCSKLQASKGKFIVV